MHFYGGEGWVCSSLQGLRSGVTNQNRPKSPNPPKTEIHHRKMHLKLKNNEFLLARVGSIPVCKASFYLTSGTSGEPMKSLPSPKDCLMSNFHDSPARIWWSEVGKCINQQVCYIKFYFVHTSSNLFTNYANPSTTVNHTLASLVFISLGTPTTMLVAATGHVFRVTRNDRDQPYVLGQNSKADNY